MSALTAVTGTDTARHLVRVRHAVVGVLTLAACLSLAANIAVAPPTVTGRVVAAWPPLALVITVDLIGRVPARRRVLSRVRVIAASGVGAIAAVLSFGHMATLAREAEAGSVAASVLPLTVDGMVVVASLTLVELGDRIRAASAAPARSARQARPASNTSDRTDETDTTTKPQVTAGAGSQGSQSDGIARTDGSPPDRPSTSSTSMAEVVQSLAADRPDATRGELARLAGCSVRTVQRHLSTAPIPAGLHAVIDDDTDSGDHDNARDDTARRSA